MLKCRAEKGRESMDEPTPSERATERVSPEELAQLQRMIEIYATQTRIKWELPAHSEAELQSCGRVGLAEAIARFDARRGAKLTTYAEHRIRGAIKNGAKALYRAKRRAGMIMPNNLRVVETGDKWDRYIDLLEDVAIGTAVAGAYESTAVREMNETVEDRLIREEEWRQLREALASLPARSQHALRRMFYDEAQGDAVAEELQIHESNVTRLKQKALSELLAQLTERNGS
jgi:RNA polymerase sigma factor (sigma-70 family)